MGKQTKIVYIKEVIKQQKWKLAVHIVRVEDRNNVEFLANGAKEKIIVIRWDHTADSYILHAFASETRLSIQGKVLWQMENAITWIFYK